MPSYSVHHALGESSQQKIDNSVASKGGRELSKKEYRMESCNPICPKRSACSKNTMILGTATRPKLVKASPDTGGCKSTIPCDSISSRVSHQETLTSSGDTTSCMTQMEGQRQSVVLLANKKSPEVTMQLSDGIFMKAIEIDEKAGYRRHAEF